MFVEFRELVKIVVVDAIAAFDRVEFLASGSKVEALHGH